MNFSERWAQHDFAAVNARIEALGTADVDEVLRRAGTRLSQSDLEVLLSPAASERLEELSAVSHALTVARFGRTIHLYAPLYVSNACSNVCTYCGFSAQNRLARKTLDSLELGAEIHALKRLGFEQVLLVTGESPRAGVEYLEATLAHLRPHFASTSLEVQPLDIADYERLVHAGAEGVYIYQETYDPIAYATHHLRGPKQDMTWRLDTPDRAGAAGLRTIGLGALYGLSDWRAEAWFLGLHLRHLEQRYWRSSFSISFPRLRPRAGERLALRPFGERELLQAACAFRLFSPEVELSLSTRERAHFRRHAFKLGFTHLSAGSKTNPGGYAADAASLEQFEIDDDRSPEEVAHQLREAGYSPIWKDWL